MNGPVAFHIVKGGYNMYTTIYFFKGLLKILKQQNPQFHENTVIFGDNLTAHLAKTTIEALKHTPFKLLINAPYSPESISLLMKKYVYNYYPLD
jgi:hypothetical protein